MHSNTEIRKDGLLFEGFPGGSVVKNLPAMQETQVQSLSWEDPLEEEMAAHFSILAWRIPWTEEPGGGVAKSQTQLSNYTFPRHV